MIVRTFIVSGGSGHCRCFIGVDLSCMWVSMYVQMSVVAYLWDLLCGTTCVGKKFVESIIDKKT